MGKANIVLTVLSVITLLVSVTLVQRGTNEFRAQEIEAPQVLSQTADNDAQATSTPSPSPQSHTPTPTFFTTPTPTPKIINQTESGSFIYPGSSVSLNTQNKIVMTSSDIPNTIMGWYNNKLNNMNMSNRKTNVKNNVNNGGDSFNATVSGSNENMSVEVEIIKKPSDSISSIIVTIN